MLMYPGVEDLYGVPCVIFLEIYGAVALGVTSVVALGVPVKDSFRDPGDSALGIPGVVAYVFSGVVSLGSAIFIPCKCFF